MAKVTPEQFVEKHNRRLKGAMQDMQTGVENVTSAPGIAAAEKADKMKQNINKAIDDGTWAKRVRAVPLEEWKSKMIDKGIPRVSGGIDAAAPKVLDFAQQLLPHIDKGVTDIEKMPDLTLEDSIARSNKFIRHMAKFSKK